MLAEDFLELDPALSHDSDALLDLIYNEVVLRERRGETPAADEYVGRFPALGDEIRRQFEIHEMFSDEDAPSSAECRTAAVEFRRRHVVLPRRAVPGSPAARQGRPGRGVRRARHRAAPRGRAQADSRPACRRPDQPPALPDRGGDRRRPRAPRHRPRLRRRNLRERPPVLRNAVHQGRQPQRDHRRVPRRRVVET